MSMSFSLIVARGNSRRCDWMPTGDVGVLVHLGPTATKVRPIYAFPHSFILLIVSPRILFYFPPFDLANFVSSAHILRPSPLHLPRIGAVYHAYTLSSFSKPSPFQNHIIILGISIVATVVRNHSRSLFHPEGPDWLPSAHKKSSVTFRSQHSTWPTSSRIDISRISFGASWSTIAQIEAPRVGLHPLSGAEDSRRHRFIL